MQTLFCGQNIVRLSQVDSTNNYTIGLLRHSVMPEGSVVVAEHQAKGKGQRGSSWISPPGQNLTFSMVLYPRFLAAVDQFYMTKAVSLGIADFLLHEGIPGVRIKWPNDIYIDDQKVAGILIENQLRGSVIQQSVVGIGINVNQVEFPEELSLATSIQKVTKKEQDLNLVLQQLCFFLERRYLSMRNEKTSNDRDYLERLYRRNERGIYRVDEQLFEGEIVNVTASGKLVVMREGREETYDFKEIAFIR